jgi:hypothetical protein
MQRLKPPVPWALANFVGQNLDFEKRNSSLVICVITSINQNLTAFIEI